MKSLTSKAHSSGVPCAHEWHYKPAQCEPNKAIPAKQHWSMA